MHVPWESCELPKGTTIMGGEEVLDVTYLVFSHIVLLVLVKPNAQYQEAKIMDT